MTMRKISLCLAIAITVCCTSRVTAQTEDPGAYIGAINNAQTEMNKTYMAYVSAAAHSRRARKIEKMRQHTLESIIDCKGKLNELPLYKGDNSLRKSSIDYTALVYKVFNDDYAHIVNMEDLVEQSYDEMQLYLLLQEKTNDTLTAATNRINQAVKDFAAKYNVKLVDDKSDLGIAMEQAGKVSKYHDKVYLIFFKCSWQDDQLTDAVNKKNIVKIEQARSALLNYANEGLASLDSFKSFQNDPSLAMACRRALTFYKQEAEKEIAKVTDLVMKEDDFNKVKKSFDAKPEQGRTQQDVDAYNKAVKDMNAAVNVANQANSNMNNNRKQVIDGWNEAEKAFSDAHVPYYK